MHPTISHRLAQARAADLRRQAQRAILARAARRAGSVDTTISALSWVLNACNVVFTAILMGAAGIAELLGRRRLLASRRLSAFRQADPE